MPGLEVGMLTSRLTELLSELNDRIELVENKALETSSVESTPESESKKSSSRDTELDFEC